ncbi:hypothetical protein NDU88_004326 [Pleurodeles waltl]|uniref:Uncharacterized protein n=1 Tax=Pleurodeles waltl TaxID=8319 RepID=A0AAV7VIC8_PLEWA|nr:hypothetical protein NDU88_004326 [Pleurodeles waltl]
MHCSMFSARPRWDHPSTSTISPVELCSAPRSLLSSITSSLWVPGLYQHCRRRAHSVAPSSILSGALQRIFRQAGAKARLLLDVLYKSPGAVLRTSILVPQRYFLIVGARLAPTPPLDCALCRAFSARGRFVRSTVAYFLPGRGETTLQHPLQVLWRPATRLIPPSLMLLPRYGCRARTVTDSGPCSQRTRALYPMHCSVFSAKWGRGRPSMCSSDKPRSRRQGRVTT